MPIETDIAVAATILKLLKNRRFGASICPSEAVRALFKESWRNQMQHIRDVAQEMTQRGQLEICQKGIFVEPTNLNGPIRLRLPETPSL